MLKSVIVVLLIGVLLYHWRLFVPESWYAPKIGEIEDFLKSHGYPVEAHKVQTEDGYILTMHRIPHGRDEDPSNYKKQRPPVFLMHGMLLCSIDWVLLGPGKAIGLLLADAGYDVWLGNNRGNTYSRAHVTLDPVLDKDKFFNYSYHEIGLYDVPAMIDYTINQTGYSKITYMGFSQGVTSFFVMGSLRPQYNEKILLMNAWAPVTHAHNIPSLLFNTLAFSTHILGIPDLLGWQEMLDYPTISPLFRLGCQIRPVCITFFYLLGASRDQLRDHDFQLAILSNFPAGMALRQIRHYIQGTRIGIFGPYNPEIETSSNKSEFPTYDLTKVTAPIIIYYGEADNLVNNDILLNTVVSALPNVVKTFQIPYPKFDHLDFLYGKDTSALTEETLRNINSFNNSTD